MLYLGHADQKLITNVANNCSINNSKTTTSRSFEYKTQIIGSMLIDNDTLGTKVVLPSKYLSIFWRYFNLLFINCKRELALSQSKDCITEISRTHATATNPAVIPPTPTEPATTTTGATFQINSTKLYVPIVTFPINNNITFLENLKERFKKKILE